MEKQKICIVGGGLTGLITAITLSKLNIKVDLVSDFNNKSNIKSNRTTAISQKNYDFLEKLNIFKFSKKEFWPCQEMKLYTKNNEEKFVEIFDIKKNEKNNKRILYMINNNILIKNKLREINNCSSIKLTTKKKVSGISASGFLKTIRFKETNNSKYNLIILCTGNNSNLTKAVFSNQSYGHSYNETSITTVLKHNRCNNNIARQVFLDDEIFALLPISESETSVVWTIKRNTINKSKNILDSLLKKKIENYINNFYQNIKFSSKLELKDINFLIRKKYFEDRVLLFGDALHQVHPLAGQGFNMILRDLTYLKKILSEKTSLGLDIGNSDTLSEFSNVTQPRNFAYSIGIDLIKNSFSFENYIVKNFRNKIISDLNKIHFAKNIFYNIADKGLKF